MTDLVNELRGAAEYGPLTFYDRADEIRSLLKRAANALEMLQSPEGIRKLLDGP